MTDPRIRRARAAESCRLRFQGRAYSPGVRDCARMALHDLRQLGIRAPFAKGLSYRGEAAGLRALRSLGFTNLMEAVDALGLPRIAPAMALPADLIALETDHALGALGVAMGNGNILAFTEEAEGAEVLTNVTGFARDALGFCAWRVI